MSDDDLYIFLELLRLGFIFLFPPLMFVGFTLVTFYKLMGYSVPYETTYAPARQNKGRLLPALQRVWSKSRQYLLAVPMRRLRRLFKKTIKTNPFRQARESKEGVL